MMQASPRPKVLPGVLSFVVCALVCAVAGAQPRYDPGADDELIRIGHTAPYSGPAAAYGTIGKAIGAYFAKVNAEGGVNGRRLELISLDDGYSPPKTKEQFRRLVERERVLLIFQSLGTATNAAVQRYINERQVPHLFVASGASRWSRPQEFPWTMGFQPDYRTEGAIYARYILDQVPDAKIAVLYQNDDLGREYLQGLRQQLGDRADDMIVATQGYEVSDATVDAQLIALKASGAEVLLTLSLPKFAAQSIRRVAALDWRPLHIVASISSSIAAVLTPAGLDNATGVVSAQFFKDPNDPTLQHDPALQAWRQWMREYYPDGDPSSSLNVFGYLAAQTLVQVLHQAGDDLTRENIMKQATRLNRLQLDMLLPGVTVDTAPDDYRPLEAMRLTRFDGRAWRPLGEVIDLQE